MSLRGQVFFVAHARGQILVAGTRWGGVMHALVIVLVAAAAAQVIQGPVHIKSRSSAWGQSHNL